MPDAMTPQALVDALAAMRNPCPCGCHISWKDASGATVGTGHTGECSPTPCRGTLAPRFPMFRRACTKAALRIIKADRGVEHLHGQQCDCHGLGWLPLAEHEAHLEMVYIAVYLFGGLQALSGVSLAVLEAAKFGQDIVEAALRALVAATGAGLGGRSGSAAGACASSQRGPGGEGLRARTHGTRNS